MHYTRLPINKYTLTFINKILIFFQAKNVRFLLFLVCRCELVVLLLLGHMRGSIVEHHLWARPCFSMSWTYIQQLCEDTGCSPEDLPEAMNDREEWRERVRDIHAGGMTWLFLVKHYTTKTNVLKSYLLTNSTPLKLTKNRNQSLNEA